jgi:uncharacterized protein (TIRG00374 family)
MKIIRILIALAGTFVFLYLVLRGDPASTFRLVSSIGIYAPFVLMMYFIGCIFDTSGWKMILGAPAHAKVSFTKLLKIHIAGESLYRCLPMGAIAGETMKTMLLSRQSKLSTSEIVSSLVLRKLFLGLSQGLYIGSGVLLGIALIAPRGFLEITAGGFSLLLVLLFVLLGIGLYKGSLFNRIYRVLCALPIVKKKIKNQKQAFNEIDTEVRRFLIEKKGKAALVIPLFFCGWLTELFETCLILAALSIPISVPMAMLFEPVVSLTRSLAFFLPAGVGVMDSGYASVFASLGIAHAVAVGAAFVLIKRGREIVWILVGLLLIWIQGGKKIEEPDVTISRIRPEMI